MSNQPTTTPIYVVTGWQAGSNFCHRFATISDAIAITRRYYHDEDQVASLSLVEFATTNHGRSLFQVTGFGGNGKVNGWNPGEGVLTPAIETEEEYE